MYDLNYVEKLSPSISPYAQTFLSKNRYVTDKTYKLGRKIDKPFYIHDSLLSHLDSEDHKVRAMSKESIKWELYYINKYFPQAKLIIHYSPEAWELYKNNNHVLFENVPKYPESSNITSKLAYDTAHETDLDKLLEHAMNAEIIHLNGRQQDSEKHVKAGSASDEVFGNRQDVLKKILKLNKIFIVE